MLNAIPAANGVHPLRPRHQSTAPESPASDSAIEATLTRDKSLRVFGVGHMLSSSLDLNRFLAKSSAAPTRAAPAVLECLSAVRCEPKLSVATASRLLDEGWRLSEVET